MNNTFSSEFESDQYIGYVYKIVCKDVNVEGVYIGSTKNFVSRRQSHKYACNNENSNAYNYKLYQWIRQNGGIVNFKFLIILEALVYNKTQLHKIERNYIDLLRPLIINTVIPFQTQKEWSALNRTKILERRRIKQIENREKINKKRREYYKKNRIKEITANKLHFQKNKERIRKERKQTLFCLCGETITYENRIRHYKTKNHKDSIQNILCL